jgi:hypothetical protein
MHTFENGWRQTRLIFAKSEAALLYLLLGRFRLLRDGSVVAHFRRIVAQVLAVGTVPFAVVAAP